MGFLNETGLSHLIEKIKNEFSTSGEPELLWSGTAAADTDYNSGYSRYQGLNIDYSTFNLSNIADYKELIFEVVNGEDDDVFNTYFKDGRFSIILPHDENGNLKPVMASQNHSVQGYYAVCKFLGVASHSPNGYDSLGVAYGKLMARTTITKNSNESTDSLKARLTAKLDEVKRQINTTSAVLSIMYITSSSPTYLGSFKLKAIYGVRR